MSSSKARRAAVVCLAATVLLSPLPASRAAPTAPGVTVSHVTELESPILVELNRVRREHGLRALRKSPALARAARAHLRALAIAGQFRHEWPDGRPFGPWITRFYPAQGARFWAVGEALMR